MMMMMMMMMMMAAVMVGPDWSSSIDCDHFSRSQSSDELGQPSFMICLFSASLLFDSFGRRKNTSCFSYCSCFCCCCCSSCYCCCCCCGALTVVPSRGARCALYFLENLLFFSARLKQSSCRLSWNRPIGHPGRLTFFFLVVSEQQTRSDGHLVGLFSFIESVRVFSSFPCCVAMEKRVAACEFVSIRQNVRRFRFETWGGKFGTFSLWFWMTFFRTSLNSFSLSATKKIVSDRASRFRSRCVGWLYFLQSFSMVIIIS